MCYISVFVVVEQFMCGSLLSIYSVSTLNTLLQSQLERGTAEQGGLAARAPC